MARVDGNNSARGALNGGMTGMDHPRVATCGGVGLRIDQLAWMTLAGGWLAAFTVTAGVANFVRPYRVAWGVARGDERYRSAPSS